MNLGGFFQLEQQVQRAIIVALLVALAVAILVGAGGTLYYRAEAAEAREAATKCAGDLAVERGNVERLKAANDAQNRAVDAFKTEAEASRRAAEAAAKAAEKAAAANRQAAAAILEAKPSNPDDLCASALVLYRQRGGK